VFPEEYMTVKSDGIIKELLVSQSLGRSQQLDYRACSTDIMHEVRSESDLAPYRTAQLWRQHLRMRDHYTIVFSSIPHHDIDYMMILRGSRLHCGVHCRGINEKLISVSLCDSLMEYNVN